MKLLINARTWKGGRDENQDNLIVDTCLEWISKKDLDNGIFNFQKIIELNDEQPLLFMSVLDGAGGGDLGHAASQIAAQAASDTYYPIISKKRKNKICLERAALSICNSCNDAVSQLNSRLNIKSASTLSFLLMDRTRVIGCNIGDSPIYRIHFGEAESLYTPHTLGTYKRINGDSDSNISEIDEATLICYCGNTELSGSEMASSQQIELCNEDKFIIMSDGIQNDLGEKTESILLAAFSTAQPLDYIWNHLSKEPEDNCTIITVQPITGTPFASSQIQNYISHNVSPEEWKDVIYEKKWSHFIESQMKSSHLTQKYLAKTIGISEKQMGTYRWETPPRDKLIALCIALKMDWRAINDRLFHSRYQKLYPKDLNDAIWLFMIDHIDTLNQDETIMHIFDSLKKLADKIEKDYISSNSKSSSNTATPILRKHLRQEADFSEYIEIVLKNREGIYKNLIETLRKYIASQRFRKRFDYYQEGRRAKRVLKNCEKKHILPSRGFILALGVRLDMDKEEINHLLDLANMMPLYPKSLLESKIIFYSSFVYKDNKYGELFSHIEIKNDPVWVDFIHYFPENYE